MWISKPFYEWAQYLAFTLWFISNFVNGPNFKKISRISSPTGRRPFCPPFHRYTHIFPYFIIQLGFVHIFCSPALFSFRFYAYHLSPGVSCQTSFRSTHFWISLPSDFPFHTANLLRALSPLLSFPWLLFQFSKFPFSICSNLLRQFVRFLLHHKPPRRPGFSLSLDSCTYLFCVSSWKIPFDVADT